MTSRPRGATPHGAGDEVGDGLVIPAQPATWLSVSSLCTHEGWLGAANGLSVDERQDLAARRIEATGPRRTSESGRFQVVEQRVHGGVQGPAGAAPSPSRIAPPAFPPSSHSPSVARSSSASRLSSVTRSSTS